MELKVVNILLPVTEGICLITLIAFLELTMQLKNYTIQNMEHDRMLYCEDSIAAGLQRLKLDRQTFTLQCFYFQDWNQRVLLVCDDFQKYILPNPGKYFRKSDGET